MKKIQQIALIVTLAHLLVLLSLSLRTPPPRKPTRITIHTLAPRSIAIAPPPSAPPAKKNGAPKKTTKTAPSKPAPKLASATSSSPPKKTAKEASREIDPPNTAAPHKPALTLPTLVIPKTLTVEATPDDTTSDPTYAELLIAYLQQTLELPEYGPVKMRLSFSAEGRLIHSEVIETKQHKNSDFLQQRLAELVFPSPPNHESTVLTITFRN